MSTEPVIEHTEESPVETNDQQVWIPETPEHTRTYEHVLTYPIAASWIRIRDSMPMPHVVRTTLFNWAYSGPVRPYTESIDTAVDGALTRFDHMVPQAQTLRMRDIRDTLTRPVVAVGNTAQTATTSVAKAGDRWILQPGRDVAAATRRGYSSVYNTNGRALIRGQADRVLTPINDTLSNALVAQFGDEAEVPKEGFSNEFSRGMRIFRKGYSKTVSTVFPRLSAMPSHVEEVYTHNRAERGNDLLASVETGRQLTSEAFSRVRFSLNPVAPAPEPITLVDNAAEGSSRELHV